MLGALPRGLGRDEWLQALPRALVAGFVKTDKEFQSRGVNFSFYSCVFLGIKYWEGRNTELEDLEFNFFLFVLLII